MSLRADDAENLDNVLYNEDELSEWHNIDGRRMLINIDNDALRSRQDMGGVAALHPGVILFFARARDFAKRPEPSGQMRFDGRPMTVQTCNEDAGQYEITLAQTRKGGAL